MALSDGHEKISVFSTNDRWGNYDYRPASVKTLKFSAYQKRCELSGVQRENGFQFTVFSGNPNFGNKFVDLIDVDGSIDSNQNGFDSVFLHVIGD